MQRKLVLVAGTGALLATVLWLWRLCDQQSHIAFLPRHGGAAWVVYPKPTVPYLQAVAELPGTFRRAFTLAQVPPSAALEVRACRRCQLLVNGHDLPLPDSAGNWKEPLRFELAKYLRPGKNTLAITVYNALGPPALWLSLRGEGLQVVSDASWDVSYAGAAWRPAQLASGSPPTAPGNPLSGGETARSALAGDWAWLLGAWLACAALVLFGRFWFTDGVGKALPRHWRWLTNPTSVLLALLTLSWLVLFTHNLSFVPRAAGFDSEGHLAYISYLQQHGALPLAAQGWEMHQPPLYYLLSAALLNTLRLSASSFDGLAVLRLLALVVGLTQVLLVFASVRLLFPGAVGKQTVGLALAGFLPMELYVTHYVTNESLAACLMSAALYFALRLVHAEHTPWHLYLALGLCLGLALLTKVTALILVPFVFAALVYRVARPGSSVPAKAEQGSDKSQPGPQLVRPGWRWAAPALTLLVCVGVCGWHYWRVWRHYGHAFFVPTQWAYGVSWWQDPGYHTAAYFTRFGRGLVAPFFSGVASFGDGLYTTLWADGLCGGAAGVLYRAPWNYDLMACGVLLALGPTLLVLVGAILSVSRLLRGSAVVWLGLLGFAGAMLLAIVHLNLEVPTYAEAKAIFGLAALIPLCAFAAEGWELVARKLGRAAPLAAVLLCLWALTSYASFWVRADAAATRAAVGRGLLKDGNLAGALTQFESALRTDPRQLAARSSLVVVLLQQNRLPQAEQAAQLGVSLHPAEALCQLDLAGVLEKQGRLEEALAHTRSAVELAPNQPEARLKLASRLFQLHRPFETIAACREALRLTPADPEVHFLLASALAAQAERPDVSLDSSGQERLPCATADGFSTNDILIGEAINHYQWVVKLAPETPDALNHLAWILATYPRAELRNGRDAVQLAQRACALTENRNPATLTTLAAAYAEAGQFGLALQTVEEAAQFAQALGKLPVLHKDQQLKELFRAQQPFRQPLAPAH